MHLSTEALCISTHLSTFLFKQIRLVNTWTILTTNKGPSSCFWDHTDSPEQDRQLHWCPDGSLGPTLALPQSILCTAAQWSFPKANQTLSLCLHTLCSSFWLETKSKLPTMALEPMWTGPLSASLQPFPLSPLLMIKCTSFVSLPLAGQASPCHRAFAIAVLCQEHTFCRASQGWLLLLIQMESHLEALPYSSGSLSHYTITIGTLVSFPEITFLSCLCELVFGSLSHLVATSIRAVSFSVSFSTVISRYYDTAWHLVGTQKIFFDMGLLNGLAQATLNAKD